MCASVRVVVGFLSFFLSGVVSASPLSQVVEMDISRVRMAPNSKPDPSQQNGAFTAHLYGEVNNPYFKGKHLKSRALAIVFCFDKADPNGNWGEVLDQSIDFHEAHHRIKTQEECQKINAAISGKKPFHLSVQREKNRTRVGELKGVRLEGEPIVAPPSFEAPLIAEPGFVIEPNNIELVSEQCDETSADCGIVKAAFTGK